VNVEHYFPKVDALVASHGESMRDLLQGRPYLSADDLAWRLRAEGHDIGPTTIKAYRRAVSAAARETHD
jgi:hypothetical protein